MAATFDDFKLFQFDQDSDQESLWKFIDISDADSKPLHHSGHTIGSSNVLVVSATTLIASPVSDPTRAHSRCHETRLVRLIDLPFQTPLNFDGDDVNGYEEEDEEEEEEDEYVLDDELVPWSVGEKLGRERMRKLGKRRRNLGKRTTSLINRECGIL